MFKKTLLAMTVATISLTSSYAIAANKPAQVTLTAGNYDHKVTGVKSDDVIGFGIRGAYRGNSNFAAELGYYKFGEADIGGIDSIVTAVEAGIKAVYPLSSYFEVYSRFGAARWKLRDFNSETGVDFYFGLGGEAIIREEIILGLSYTQFTADADSFNYRIGGIEFNMGFRF